MKEGIENYKRRKDFQRRVRGANITGVYRGNGQGSGQGSPAGNTMQHHPVGDAKRINPFNNNPPTTGIHRCTICGRTDADNEDLEFRYCSKCNGGLEYCMDHLYTHEHRH